MLGGELQTESFWKSVSERTDRVQTPHGEGLFAEMSEPQRLHPKVRAGGAAAGRGAVTMAAPCRVSSSLSCQSQSLFSALQRAADRLVHPATRKPSEARWAPVAELCWVTGLTSSTERHPGQEQRRAALTTQQPLELQLLQAPAKQLACIIQLVAGASGYPAEQEKPAKKHTFHLPACPCSLPGSVLPRGKQPQTCLAHHDSRAQLHVWLLPVNLTTNSLRGAHKVWNFKDWLHLRALLKYNSLGDQTQ